MLNHYKKRNENFMGSGELAEWFRVCTAPVEYPSAVPVLGSYTHW